MHRSIQPDISLSLERTDVTPQSHSCSGRSTVHRQPSDTSRRVLHAENVAKPHLHRFSANPTGTSTAHVYRPPHVPDRPPTVGRDPSRRSPLWQCSMYTYGQMNHGSVSRATKTGSTSCAPQHNSTVTDHRWWDTRCDTDVIRAYSDAPMRWAVSPWWDALSMCLPDDGCTVDGPRSRRHRPRGAMHSAPWQETSLVLPAPRPETEESSLDGAHRDTQPRRRISMTSCRLSDRSVEVHACGTCPAPGWPRR
ncbi:hypothetical protein BD413DRAFT_152547 [Trametes elegans]|nr:hypothetical protein BD413DRAFT_152547 [Trametes elegans]